jgi:hypothetical protein
VKITTLQRVGDFRVGMLVSCDGYQIGGEQPFDIMEIRIDRFTPQRVRLRVLHNNGCVAIATVSLKRIGRIP